MGALDIYRVEHREDPHGPWQRVEALPVRWDRAVEQLGHAAEAALDGTDPDEPDDITAEGQEFLRVIGKGLLREIPSPASTYTGRYLRITAAAPTLADPLIARLRWAVIHDAGGRAAVTINTYAGHVLHGTVAWDGIEPEGISLRHGGRTTVLRPERVESYALGVADGASGGR